MTDTLVEIWSRRGSIPYYYKGGDWIILLFYTTRLHESCPGPWHSELSKNNNNKIFNYGRRFPEIKDRIGEMKRRKTTEQCKQKKNLLTNFLVLA